MAKSKNQTKSGTQSGQATRERREPTEFSAEQPRRRSDDEFQRTVQRTFGEFVWPTGRKELLEYAKQQAVFAQPDLARLDRIPDREYHSLQDLMKVVRQMDMPIDQNAESMTKRRPAAGTPAPEFANPAAQHPERTH